jgi:hypothetical protein
MNWHTANLRAYFTTTVFLLASFSMSLVTTELRAQCLSRRRFTPTGRSKGS